MEEVGRNGEEGGSGRWCPTKEQIAVLESLYKQGVRTPSSEQIQHITGKLREFGSIEGKNVFYWFQNHKARQRQRQKQENFAYFSSLNYRAPPPSPAAPPGVVPQMRTMPASYHRAAMPTAPSSTNLISSPYFMPESVGCYLQPQPFHPNFATSLNRNPNSEIQLQRMQVSRPRRNQDINSSYYPAPSYQNSAYNSAAIYQTHQDVNQYPRKTLDLFPLHPTGFQDKSSSPAAASPDSERSGDDGFVGLGGGGAESLSIYTSSPTQPRP